MRSDCVKIISLARECESKLSKKLFKRCYDRWQSSSSFKKKRGASF